MAVAVSLGIFLFLYKQKQDYQIKIQYEPEDIKVVNIGSNSATVTWQTTNLTIGSLVWGTSSINLNEEVSDDRDSETTSARVTHFVTLENLEPENEYYFQIKSAGYTFPNSPLEFKTSPLADSKVLAYKPIIGKILNSSLQPVEDALIFLSTPQSSEIATYATAAGNFILPLNNLKTKDLLTNLVIPNERMATLIIKKAEALSTVKISLSQTGTLPPITLGQDADFTLLPQPSTPPLDVNQDGEINAVDASIIQSNMGKQPILKQADVNSDGFVDINDLKLVEEGLSKESVN